MFVKQITQSEALNLAAKGIEVMTMIPDSENSANWNAMTPDTLQNLLNGLMFFRREPAVENPIIEEEEISTSPYEPAKLSGGSPEAASSTDKSATDCAASGKERKKKVAVDTGKLLALRKAGWTIGKIADELNVSVSTVCNYLKKLEEEKSAEG